jgi:hypothetical protein
MHEDIHTRLDQLMHQEMTRKKFILVLGTGDFGGNDVKHVRKIEVK